MSKIISILLISLLTTSCASANENTDGTKWDRFINLAKTNPRLIIGLDKAKFIKNDLLAFAVLNMPQTGYLTVFSIDEDDKITVLFPNKQHRNNKIKKGHDFVFPRKELNFQIITTEPFGKSLVVAILSPRYIQPRERSIEKLISDSNTGIYPQLSNEQAEQLTKSFTVMPISAQPVNNIQIGVKEVLTCATKQDCP